MKELIAFARELIRIPSPSGAEGALARRVIAEFERLGYDEAWIDEAGNALGRIRGEEPGPGWVFLTHLDHVDPGDEAAWPYPPFSGYLDEKNQIWGRGAVDIKGPLASTVYLKAFLPRRPQRDVLVASVVEEELGGRGAEYLVKTMGKRFGATVVAEPSSLEVMHGHRGVARVRVRFYGQAHHAALASPEENPHWALARFYERLRVARKPSHPLLGASQITPTVLFADTQSQNRTPGHIELILDWRTVGESPEAMRAFLAELLRGLPAEAEVPELWEHGELENTPGFVTPPEHPLIKALLTARERVLGKPGRPSLWFFATDGRYTAAAGIPTAGLGPGDPKLAHTEKERVYANELVQAAKLYGNLAVAAPPT